MWVEIIGKTPQWRVLK